MILPRKTTMQTYKPKYFHVKITLRGKFSRTGVRSGPRQADLGCQS